MGNEMLKGRCLKSKTQRLSYVVDESEYAFQ